jgi:hypothetical protein
MRVAVVARAHTGYISRALLVPVHSRGGIGGPSLRPLPRDRVAFNHAAVVNHYYTIPVFFFTPFIFALFFIFLFILLPYTFLVKRI